MAPRCSSFTLLTVDGAYNRLLVEGSRERPHALAKRTLLAQLNGFNPEFSVALNLIVHSIDKSKVPNWPTKRCSHTLFGWSTGKR